MSTAADIPGCVWFAFYSLGNSVIPVFSVNQQSRTKLESLFEAIVSDDLSGAKKLVASDSDLVSQVSLRDFYDARIPHWIYVGDSALHVAAASYQIRIALMLITAGADCSSAGNRRRSQPIHYACDGCLSSANWDQKKQVEMVRLLIKAGSDIDAQDQNGATPLHRSVRTRCAKVVRCLLEAGANPRIRNKSGSTPFHLSVQNTGRGGSGDAVARDGQREILLLFLKHGLSPNLKDARGKSVADWAKSEWIRELLENGAV